MRPPVGKSGPETKRIRSSIGQLGLRMRWTVASMTSLRLCGGMFVAMPTAMPPEPLTSRFGTRDGRTVGSSFESSKFGTKSTHSLSMSVRSSTAMLREARLGVSVGGRGVAVDRAVVALAVDERVAHREVLGEADHRVVDARVAVRVVVAEHVADDRGALAVRAAGTRPFSYAEYRMRRWTGLRPSRTSGMARPMMTLIA